MNDGWIKISRKLLDWEWADDLNMLGFWLRLLLMANWEDKKWHGKVIKRGQLVTSVPSLSTDNFTERQVRTALARLVECGAIKKEYTNKYSIITICNYEKYQICDTFPPNFTTIQCVSQKLDKNNCKCDSYNNTEICDVSQKSVKCQTDVRQMSAPKEIKKERIEKESNTCVLPKKEVGDSFFDKQKKMEQRNKEFYEELIPYVDIYGKDMIREFYDYWTEPNKSNTQSRKDMERTWNTSRRLTTWSKNNFRRNETNKPNNTADIATAREERRTELAGIIQARIAQIEADGG